MASIQVLPRQNRSGTQTWVRAIPSQFTGKGFQFILDTTEALHNNPAESVQFKMELSFDNQATWTQPDQASPWPGGPVGIGKDGGPMVRSIGAVTYPDAQGRDPTHARGTYVVIGSVNFGVIVRLDD